jgi:FkbM family methyltransferase
MVAAHVRSAARALGFEVTRYLPRNFTHLRRVELLRSGRASVLVDAGAADGGWAEQCRRSGFTGRIVSIEPRSAAFAELERRSAADPDWTIHRVALGSEPGTVDLHVSPEGMASSVLPLGRQVEIEPSHAYIATETVPLARLDDLSGIREDDAAYLKVDVQGYELPVLEGAAATIGRAAAVELELSFVPLYEGQALAHDLMGWLDGRGFRLASIEVSWRDRTTGDVLLANGIFLPAS